MQLLVSLFVEARGHGAPVDDLPYGVKVLCLAILVLEVVGVLPRIDAEERLEVSGDGVLVGARDDAEGSRRLFLDEPGPAGALDAGKSRVGLLLEVGEGAKVLVDGGLSGRDSQRLFRFLLAMTLGVGHARAGPRRTMSLPSGSPPPPLALGARFSQKREWLTWPPP